MVDTLSIAKGVAQAETLAPLHGQAVAVHRKFSMAKAKQNQAVKVETRFKKKPRPTFIRQWREHRGLSQARLGERIGKSEATISQIENGRQGYSQENLEAIAEALQTDPASLLMRDPSDSEGIWSLWERAKPTERKQILGIIEGFLRNSAA